ncbi:uncharacterized protein HMPREF1541_03070 [Cyphellophora europaea CBS 101466]|uniref:DUF1907 domain-containing protein n=1 Tax=Cyphellophora europaea (strain CBS 101466) TaxID=1220924 RepID=W2RXT3_CYPE1|nr:uncharacterized protein HMPREF1541_03070 [Cyphellophora europaea CBS 101466]ETN41135.1 hypothetical protein HMPREF1541_03070 [Cyphellophora europaea CBS 101466]
MSWPVQKRELSPPPLDELAGIIAAGLESNFEQSSVQVEPCTDLRKAPFYLAGEGLNGSTRVGDVGGPPHLAPPDFSKKYDFMEISKLMEMPQEKGFLLGAGAGPFYVLGCNAELIPNISYENGEITNLTHYAKIAKDDQVECQKIETSTGFAFMANLFGSEGLPGPALHIKASSRKGAPNFTETIQAAVQEKYGDKLVSLGGVFVIKRGRANLHVMGDFPEKPLQRQDVDDWLRRFEFDAPLICLSVLHTGDDQGMALRPEHTHCFSVGGKNGGHYHFDVEDTKADVEYEAWYNVAEAVFRIDSPGRRY